MRREGKDQWPDKHLSGTSDGLLRLLGKSVRGKTVTPTELPRWGRGATIRQVRGVLSLKETQKSGAHFASRKKQKRRETLAYEFFCIFWVLFDVSSSSKAELKIDPGKVDNNSPEFLHKEESVKSKLKRILQNKWVPWMAQQVKNLPTMQEMWVPISGSGSSPRKENGNPLQYSYLGNPTDRGAWRATVRWVAKNRIRLSNRTCTQHLPLLSLSARSKSKTSLEGNSTIKNHQKYLQFFVNDIWQSIKS